MGSPKPPITLRTRTFRSPVLLQAVQQHMTLDRSSKIGFIAPPLVAYTSASQLLAGPGCGHAFEEVAVREDCYGVPRFVTGYKK